MEENNDNMGVNRMKKSNLVSEPIDSIVLDAEDYQSADNNDIFVRAHELKLAIEAKSAELKELTEDYEYLVSLIRKNNLVSPEYELRERRAGVKKANPQFFRDNYPEFYANNSHLSHPKAVALMVKMNGGNPQKLYQSIRNALPEEYDAAAVIAMEDVKKEFSAKELEGSDAIVKTEAKEFDVIPRAAWQRERMLQEVKTA